MKKNLFFGVVVSMALLSGCKKDKEEVTVAPSVLLTAKSWKIADIGVTTAGGSASTLSFLAACDKDDLTMYKADGKIVLSEGATKCDPGDEQETPGGTWTLSTDGKTLTEKVGTTSTVYTVKELTAGSLKVTTTESGSNYSEYMNYTAQ